MHHRSTTAILLLALCATGCADEILAPVDNAATGPALAPVVSAPAGLGIAGRWIVVLKSDAGPAAHAAQALLAASGGRLGRSFDASLRGFTATLSAAELERLRMDPNVAYVEQDAIVSVASVPWNLERIGQPTLATSLTAGWTGSGAGVHAYVIDTGIRTTHREFGGRARDGFDAVDGGAAEDCNGHGTHVAGTIGGASWGVARRASLIAVRVLDCGGTGTVSDVVAGIDWVAAHHVKPAVANLSVVGGASRAVDDAVARAIDAGVVFVVAAGNDARDACGYSPARAPAAITVGATTRDDAIWALSNQGGCIDLFAPGEGIVSAWHTEDRADGTLSGTSMAAPHATGAVALLLEHRPDASPADVAGALRDAAVPDRLSRVAPDSPDLLLQLRLAPRWRDVRGWL